MSVCPPGYARERTGPAKQDSPRLLSDCSGLIERLVMLLPPGLLDRAAGDRQARLAALGNLIAALVPGIRLTILTEPGALAAAEAWVARLAPRCSITLAGKVPANTLREEDLWARDSLIVWQGGEGPVYGQPLGDRRNGLATWLGALDGVPVKAVPLHLEGGNQLVGGTIRIVGYQSLAKSREPLWGGNGSLTLAGERLRQMDDRRLCVFGYGGECASLSEHDHAAQYGFHLDLFLSVTGLASGEKPLVLLAEPFAHCKGAAVTAGMARARRALDRTAEGLERSGLTVLRNPVPFAPLSGSAKRYPRYYNNVILDGAPRAGSGRPLVWLPCYGDQEASLRPFDAANANLWERLGFEAVPVYGWSSFVRLWGGIRCATNITERGPACAPQDPAASRAA